AGVEPAGNVDYADLGTLVDHVLEGVGEKIFALVLRLLQHPVDSFEKQLPVANVVQSDVGATRDRSRWLLDDPGHVAVLVGTDNAAPLVVLYLLDQDDSVGLDTLNFRQVGAEDRIDK